MVSIITTQQWQQQQQQQKQQQTTTQHNNFSNNDITISINTTTFKITAYSSQCRSSKHSRNATFIIIEQQ
jgi:hypothetical protein